MNNETLPTLRVACYWVLLLTVDNFFGKETSFRGIMKNIKLFFVQSNSAVGYRDIDNSALL